MLLSGNGIKMVGILLILAIAAIVLLATPSPPVTSTSTMQSVSLPPIKHVILIMLENKGYTSVMGNSSAPYQNLLASRYSVSTDYFAVAHPSLPNYFAIVGGATFNISLDCLPVLCSLGYSSIANLLDAHGLSWKAYEESMPVNCSQGVSPDGLYAPKHNPFVYFTNISGNYGFGGTSSYCQAHDVSFAQFWADLQAQDLPAYSFITPNLCNDAHDCPLKTADNWLSKVVPRIINSSSFSSTALFIVYDEGNSNSSSARVALILASPFSKRGYVSQVPYNHYSLLATIEAIFSLGNLGRNDMTANVMADMFIH